jgi:hypothetical protein
MSDAWSGFKRAFGATQGREVKAQAAVDELLVQSNVRRALAGA